MSSSSICPHCQREFELTETGYCPHCGRKFEPGDNKTLKIVLIVVALIVLLPMLAFGACVLFLSAHT